MIRDVVVVGGGLFGKIIAAALQQAGARVAIISDDRADTGSAAAGCVIRPSWVNTMDKAALQDSLRLLDELYGLQEITFVLPPLSKTVTCHRIEPSKILMAPYTFGRVLSLEDNAVVAANIKGEVYRIEAKKGMIVATGVWAQQLTPWIGKVEPRWGWAHRGPPIPQSIIKLWAPYRQVVAFTMDDGKSWSGDGSAFKELSDIRAEKARQRCLDVINATPQQVQTIRGIRPYAETQGAPCLLKNMGRVWAVTGGAKNGTVAAAWAARRLVREVLR